MSRPRIDRKIEFQPNVTYFKPAGVMMTDLDEVIITFDETEAVRLSEVQKIGQKEAAKKMDISQPTFHRLLESARRKIADALINGKAIKIEGGNFKMMQSFGRGGQGRGQGRAGGPSKCVCPSCGYEEAHIRGTPCATKECPKCKTRMVGKW
jgi:uncharacterized protein